MAQVSVVLKAHSIDELNQKIEDYFNLYHPLGYGTAVFGRMFRNPEGEFCQEIRRWESCD